MRHQSGSLDPTQVHRAAGVLLGQVCGDALGVPYEFATPPRHNELAEMKGGGLGPYAPGEWSDDTQMATCVAQVAATGADLSDAEALDQIGERFLEWAPWGASDIGLQTSGVLAAARSGPGSAGQRLTRAAQRYAANHPRSAGNGALMRTAVVGLSALDDQHATAAAARAVAELTHANPLAGDSCVIWCEAIRVAVVEGRFDIRAGLDLVPSARRDRWATWIDDAELLPAGSFAPNGFTVTALQAAWAAVSGTRVPPDLPESGSFEAAHLAGALQAAVQIGNDTDTIAAVAGGLLGARWGASAMPAEWRTAVHGWPGLRSRDLVALAVLTARGGSPDASGWPTIEHLAHHEARGPVPVVAHPHDDGVTLGPAWPNEHDADVVVSLCQLGTSRRYLPVVDAADHLDVWLVDSDDPAANPHLGFVLADTAAFIAQHRDRGRQVYVHCVAALQRTPSVALAYAAYRGHDPRTAGPIIQQALPDSRGQGRLWDAAARVQPTR